MRTAWLAWLDRFPLGLFIIGALLLGLSPFMPEPHLWEKLKMLAAGALTRPDRYFRPVAPCLAAGAAGTETDPPMGHAALGSVSPANDIASPPRTVGVILPVLNEAGILDAALTGVLEQGPDEIVVVDGGSDDATRDIVRNHPRIRLLDTARGRAAQMNAGAAEARSDILLFLHADTRLPPQALSHVRAAIQAGHLWGRFDVRLDGARPAYRVIERCMNLRSALTGIATGDQAIFVRRDVFERLGGYARLRSWRTSSCPRVSNAGSARRVRAPVVTSARRWEQHGILRTVLRMWRLRLLYWLGMSPARLARWYA